MNKLFKVCQHCGKKYPIYPYEINRSKFCSRICQTTFISRHRPPRKLKIIKDKQGYILEWCPKHPYHYHNKYYLQHRIVMEKSLGRYLKKYEHVHHINGDKSDNKIENLKLMSKRKHQGIHNSLRIISKETREKMKKAKIGSIPWNKKI